MYGLPELHRAEIATANYISGVGCNATASNLALLPVVKADLLDFSSPIYIEIKVGSSESGAEGNSGSLHSERANVIRTFSAFGHRHTAEVIRKWASRGGVSLDDDCRGFGARCAGDNSCKSETGRSHKGFMESLSGIATENPFVRVVKEGRGIYRVPTQDPGRTNYVDVGFELAESTGTSYDLRDR